MFETVRPRPHRTKSPPRNTPDGYPSVIDAMFPVKVPGERLTNSAPARSVTRLSFRLHCTPTSHANVGRVIGRMLRLTSTPWFVISAALSRMLRKPVEYGTGRERMTSDDVPS